MLTIEHIQDEMDPRPRRAYVWLYTVRGLALEGPAQRDELQASLEHHGTRRESLRRLNDALVRQPDEEPALTPSLSIRVRRGDTVLMCQRAFEALPVSLRAQVVLTLRARPASLMLVRGTRWIPAKPQHVHAHHALPSMP